MAACSLHADTEEFVLRYLMLLDIDLLVSLSNCRPLVLLIFKAILLDVQINSSINSDLIVGFSIGVINSVSK